MTVTSGSLDANVFMRLILRDVPKQSDAALSLVEKGQSFLIAEIAVVETVFALERYYKVPRAEIANIMQIVSGNSKLGMRRDLMEEALSAYVNFPKLSFEDCCLAARAKLDAALPLWTFDEKLAKQLPELTRLIKAT